LDLPEPAPLPITSLVCGDGGGGGDDSEEDTTSTTAHNRSSSDLLQEAAARFILKTKESHRLTQTSMNCIIEDMTSFNQIMLSELHYATSEALSAAGVDPQIICSLAPLFRDDGQFGHPFGGLETTYQQIKYFRKHFNFIEPRAITLGSVLIEKGVGARRRRAEEPEKMVYIPLLETLEAVLQNRNIITEVHISVCAWSVCCGTQQF